MAKSRIAKPAPKACFMAMPEEILARILSYASTHDGTIMPEQFAPGSTKFSLQADPAAPLGTGYCPALTRKKGALPAELSALDVARTCKTFHDIVDGDKMFYTNNTFEFISTQFLLNYLAALPSERRNAIRSLKVKYDYHGVPAAAFIVLAVCYGLEHLILDIGGMTNFFNPGLTNFSQAPGYAQLMALRGLKSVKLAYGNKSWTLIDDILARNPRAWVSQEKAESEKAVLRVLKQLENNINGATTQPRTHGSVAIWALKYAMNHAAVNAWGDTINGMLTPPGQATTGLSNNNNHNMTQGIVRSVTPAGQPQTLSETDQWLEMDRTNLASWDV
ncbi:hypothetical protein BGZ57DRAFT_949882 [Hyaloscypha finlandica]|nr:hypothetical protein BGZ57DRAFT_949882 [Hyaloscypha finlandica]